MWLAVWSVDRTCDDVNTAACGQLDWVMNVCTDPCFSNLCQRYCGKCHKYFIVTEKLQFFIKFFFMNIHWNNVTRKSMISLVLVDFSLVKFVIQPCKYVDTKNLVLYVVMLLCNTFMLAKYSQRRKLCRSSRKMSSIYM